MTEKAYSERLQSAARRARLSPAELRREGALLSRGRAAAGDAGSGAAGFCLR